MTSSQYRISILIPLYRSMRFIDNITRIIEENINSDYEFLLSDLHGFDDTIEVLKAKYSKKYNVKFFKEQSKKGWNENINLLIRNCTAKYFIIQPHDDYSPPERFKNLYDTIEKNPKTVLTFGSYKAVDLHDNLIKKRSYCPPNGIEQLSNWNTKTVMEMYWKNYFNGAFKGLVRRNLIVDNQLYILPTKDLELADRCWLFGLGLIGSFQFAPDAVLLKRHYEGSTHTKWKKTKMNFVSRSLTLYRYTKQNIECKKHRHLIYYNIFINTFDRLIYFYILKNKPRRYLNTNLPDIYAS